MTALSTSDRRHGKRLLSISAFMVAASVAVLWSWNAIAAELFALTPMQFKHAFAVVLVCFVAISFKSLSRLLTGKAPESTDDRA